MLKTNYDKEKNNERINRKALNLLFIYSSFNKLLKFAQGTKAYAKSPAELKQSKFSSPNKRFKQTRSRIYPENFRT